MTYPAASPRDEAERLAALRSLFIVDTPPEHEYDGVTSYCRARFKVAISLIAFVERDRQWYKSVAGLDVREMPRATSFSAHAIAGDGVLVVEDASRDPRFGRHPLVAGPPHVRFYAGAPLILSSGHRVGALAILHPSPIRFVARDAAHLADVARAVARHVEQARPSDFGELPAG